MEDQSRRRMEKVERMERNGWREINSFCVCVCVRGVMGFKS